MAYPAPFIQFERYNGFTIQTDPAGFLAFGINAYGRPVHHIAVTVEAARQFVDDHNRGDVRP